LGLDPRRGVQRGGIPGSTSRKINRLDHDIHSSSTICPQAIPRANPNPDLEIANGRWPILVGCPGAMFFVDAQI
jgi:hypothetical protein